MAVEQDLFKPVHQARVDAGTINGWSLWQMVLPGGTSQRHNYGTATTFRSMADMQASYPDGVWEEVHPDRDIDDIMEQMYASRDLVQMELWELVDYVAQEPPATSER